MPSQANGTPDPKPLPPWSRKLALPVAIIFLLSCVFPVAAALSKDTASFPRWWGVLDVVMAFILAVLAFAIVGGAQGKISKDTEAATYRAYRVLIHVIFFLIIVFFLFGDRITWINGLPGIAWRAWLLLYALPAWLVAAKRHEASERAGYGGLE